MKPYLQAFFNLLLLVSVLSCPAQTRGGHNAIYSGIPWFDDKGDIVSAHGACILKDGSRYYLFGEKHSDTSNAFAGFTCYSSADLTNWKFERIALPPQAAGKLGPNRVGERVKVMRCGKTGEYVMYMHVDTLGYRDQFVGYATAEKVTGPYTFKGPLLFEGKPIRKWDMGSFQDSDGSGYILLHGGEMYKLADDYKSLSAQVSKSFDRELEAPTVFRKDSLYYFIGSHLSSWEKNDNYYFTATSLKGPWTKRGTLAPEGSLTWYSQSTFVLPVSGSKGTTFLFMGDRWSFPKQASAATYVWQPLNVSGTSLSIPKYTEAWQINTATGLASDVAVGGKLFPNTDSRFVSYTGAWQDSMSFKSSAEKGAVFRVKFNGKQAGFYGLARSDGGYALVTIENKTGKTILTAIVDMYCKYSERSLKFLSPVLPKGQYTLTVTVMGERGNWSDKRRSDYGSSGYVVSVGDVVVQE